MNKIVLTPLIIFAFMGNIISQETELDFTIGYQKHDKRFNPHPDFVTDPGAWGTLYFSANINKSIPVLDRFAVKVGLGYAKEINTYNEPFDNCFFPNPGGGCAFIGTSLEQYTIDMIQTSITPKLNITKTISFNFNILPQFDFHKDARGVGSTSGFTFGIYSIEFNPELELSIDKMNVGLGYRFYQVKSIDHLFDYGNNFLTQYPGYEDRNFDTYNPTKVLITIGCDF